MIRLLTAFALALSPTLAQAQAQNEPSRQAPPGPAIQRIATASAVSTEQLGAIQGVRELPDGRVLVNDGVRRRLLLMDTTMNTVEVVLDSLSEIANTYGTRPGALIPFRGDTTLFVDPASFAVVVLDPKGQMTRVRSVWRVQDVPWFTNVSGTFGFPAPDTRGRIIYRVPARAAPPKVAPPSGVPYFPPEPDSAFIVAVNLETRMLDTLGAIRTPKTESRIRQSADNSFIFEQIVNPLPATDDWAVLPDGTIAFVRWRDYRIEYLHPDGKVTSSQKLPFDWQRLLDDDKQRLVDSVKAVQQRQAATQYVAQMIRWVNLYNRPYPENFKIPEGMVLPPGLARDWMLPPGVKFPENYLYACAPGVEMTVGAPVPITNMQRGAALPAGAAQPPAGTPAGMPSCLPAPITMGSGATPPMPTMRTVHVMPPAELPDYRPPIPTGAVRADMDGNLWIRTNPMRPTPGGPVYDIVNSQGELFARYQLPPGYQIAGFGKDKVVYLTMRDAKGLHLARVRLR